jgi:hypothetical protein
MSENIIKIAASLIIAGIMVYVIEKFGGTDNNEPFQ